MHEEHLSNGYRIFNENELVFVWKFYLNARLKHIKWTYDSIDVQLHGKINWFINYPFFLQNLQHTLLNSPY